VSLAPVCLDLQGAGAFADIPSGEPMPDHLATQSVLVDPQLSGRGHAAPLVALQRLMDGAFFEILQHHGLEFREPRHQPRRCLGRQAGSMSPPLQRIKAYSMTFSSSRMLPGHHGA
jgi:hypothetical protein